MLDVAKPDERLKLKALGRLMLTNHPFLRIIKAKLDLTSFFDPKVGLALDGMVNKGIEFLKLDKDKMWELGELDRN